VANTQQLSKKKISRLRPLTLQPSDNPSTNRISSLTSQLVYIFFLSYLSLAVLCLYHSIGQRRVTGNGRESRGKGTRGMHPDCSPIRSPPTFLLHNWKMLLQNMLFITVPKQPVLWLLVVSHLSHADIHTVTGHVLCLMSGV